MALPPARLKIFQSDIVLAGLDRDVMADCVQTARALESELAGDAEIVGVWPEVAAEYCCLSVLVRPGGDLDVCRKRLLGFYRGYMLRFQYKPESKAREMQGEREADA